jgi:hypothetical protein
LLYIALYFGQSIVSIFSEFSHQLDSISEKGCVQVLFDVLFLSKLLEGIWLAEGAYHSERLELKKAMTSLTHQYKSKV